MSARSPSSRRWQTWTSRLSGWPAIFVFLVIAAISCRTHQPAGVQASSRPRPKSRLSLAYRITRDALPRRFVEHETPRFMLLADTGRSVTQRHAELLERTHHQYERFCRQLRISPGELEHKLVVVLFEDRDDYQQFATRHDGVNQVGLAGYYSPQHDRVVVYDIDSNPSVIEARRQLAIMQDEITRLRERIRQAQRRGEDDSTVRGVLGQYRDHYRRQREVLEQFSRQSSTSTCVHEATHQLLFHTGVQRRDIDYPIWLSEGLATSFETDEPGVAFGPDHEYEPRRATFTELLEADELLSLEKLMTMPPSGLAGARLMHVVYHQSYALTAWLYRFRTEELAAYLNAFRAEPSGRLRPGRAEALAIEAFGDLDALERAWLRHERAR